MAHLLAGDRFIGLSCRPGKLLVALDLGRIGQAMASTMPRSISVAAGGDQLESGFHEAIVRTAAKGDIAESDALAALTSSATGRAMQPALACAGKP